MANLTTQVRILHALTCVFSELRRSLENVLLYRNRIVEFNVLLVPLQQYD